MARVGRAAALALLVLCASVSAVSAKKEHVKVLLGQTEFEEAIKVRVTARPTLGPDGNDAYFRSNAYGAPVDDLASEESK